MKNLDVVNIYSDAGAADPAILAKLELQHDAKLPREYVDFITQHNEAYLRANVFDYRDPSRAGGANSGGIAFVNISNISNDIALLQSNNEGPDMAGYFEDGLIPFGETGGGDMICFDYRDNPETDDPPIVLWDHEVGFKDGVFFIANNFEEFVNMLHEPEDE